MHRVVVTVLFLLSCLGNVAAQHVVQVDLKKSKISYALQHFYIKDVVDSRAEQDGIGYMKGDRLGVNNGVAGGLKELINSSVSQNRGNTGMTLHVTQLECEIKKKGGQWETTMSLGIALYYEDKQLIEYSGKGSVKGGNDPVAQLSSLIAKSFKNNIAEFDKWWAENRGRVPTEKGVKLFVELQRSSDKEGLLVYNASRALGYDDFRGPPRLNTNEAAETASGLGFSYKSEVKDGQLVVRIKVYASFNMDESWFKKQHKNARVLAHEQLHFDITALHACTLFARLKAANLSKENYQKEIENIEKDEVLKGDAEQDAYDTETNHGTIGEKQSEWEKKIKKEVMKCGCY